MRSLVVMKVDRHQARDGRGKRQQGVTDSNLASDVYDVVLRWLPTGDLSICDVEGGHKRQKGKS